MPKHHAPPPELSADERRQLSIEAETELRQLHDQIDELEARVRPLATLLDELRRLDNDELIAGRTPADIFDDPQTLHVMAQREWNQGRGSRELSDFLDSAFRSLAPGVMGYQREVAEDYVTVSRLMPKLYLRYQQDVTELAAALRRVHPVLAVDGVMKVDLLEHTCGENGSWHLEVLNAQTATLFRNRREDRSGELDEILSYVARQHWGTDGPHEHDD